MIKKLIAFGLVIPLMGALVLARAADSEKEAPQDPQMRDLPHSIALMKTFVYKPTPEDPNQTPKEKAAKEFLEQMSPRLLKVEVLKSGEIRKENRRYSTGKTAEVWRSGRVTFFEDSTNPGIVMVSTPEMRQDSDDTGPAKEVADFEELGWVSREAFQGRETRQGVPCLMYKNGSLAAWLDASTRLPILFVAGDHHITYSYKPLSQGPLVLPDRLVKELNRSIRGWRGEYIRH